MSIPYQKLTSAIIIQAANDYRDALNRLIWAPCDQKAMSRALECERFFRSQWYEALTTVDGEYLIKKLREEVKGNDRKRVFIPGPTSGSED